MAGNIVVCWKSRLFLLQFEGDCALCVGERKKDRDTGIENTVRENGMECKNETASSIT